MPKSTTYLDANCLLRYVLGDNAEQAERVTALIQSLPSVHVANEAFCEFVWVLESFYEMNRTQIADRMALFLDQSKVRCERNLLQQAMQQYLEHPAISFIDSLLALKAHYAGGRLATFDKPLSKKLPQYTNLISAVAPTS